MLTFTQQQEQSEKTSEWPSFQSQDSSNRSQENGQHQRPLDQHSNAYNQNPRDSHHSQYSANGGGGGGYSAGQPQNYHGQSSKGYHHSSYSESDASNSRADDDMW